MNKEPTYVVVNKTNQLVFLKSLYNDGNYGISNENNTTQVFLISISVVHMKEDGYHIISQTDCTELHYKYAEEKV